MDDSVFGRFAWLVLCLFVFGLWAVINPRSFSGAGKKWYQREPVPQSPDQDPATMRGVGILWLMVSVGILIALGLDMYVRSRN